jgi:hypothetical protein
MVTSSRLGKPPTRRETGRHGCAHQVKRL